MKSSHKVISIFLGLIFLIFAGLQFNDPDPWVWVPLYVVPAILFFVSAFKKIPGLILILMAFAYATGAFYLWPDQFSGLTGSMVANPEVELARESLGLMICSVSMGSLALGRIKKRRKR